MVPDMGVLVIMFVGELDFVFYFLMRLVFQSLKKSSNCYLSFVILSKY